MKRYRIGALLLSIVLFVNMLTGCSANVSQEDEKEPKVYVAELNEEGIPIRWQNGGGLSFLDKEPITIPKFSEIECERVDVEPLIAKIDALTEKAKECDDAEELLADFYAFYPEWYHYWTMSSLSYIRLTQDRVSQETNDLFDYFAEPDALLNESTEKLYEELSQNASRDALEQAYFGEGFFDYYDEYNTASDTYVELAMKEDELFQKYYDEAGDGLSVWDLNGVKRKHDALAEIFVEMVKVRNQIAIEKGCNNYMEYIYPTRYGRDYSIEEAKEFLKQVKSILVPLGQNDVIWEAEAATTCRELPFGARALEKLSNVAEQLGGPIWDAYRFMTEYELYDLSNNSNKMDVAYVSYLYEYEVPVIIIKQEGASYTTLSHEFGHFLDRYYNYSDEVSMDIEEIYSQVMEYLYLLHDDVDQKIRDKNIQTLISDTLTYAIFRECAYADFELQVYELSPEEVTAEKIDNIFFECMKEYGLIDQDAPSSEGLRWVGYHHFFDRSGYVISYATSAVAALEICAMDLEEPGAAVDALTRLLNRTHGKEYSYVLKEAGLANPFEADTLNKIADFIKHTFHID